eukprot:TRINITY_DN15067_c0_g1_i1.p1 TRINITY_DN15067_c0_g1~~TRINITY_DN15067_c0_g1_i1.p1  ORF type:complete len:252 (+),score=91.31 TRINITY_DN15067_c0_g1_i1:89-844(+)
MAFFTPVNQVRLTNVSIVRLKKGGKRFELACYPNKVKSWRDGIEKDIDEVWHSNTVFTNVSKGVAAKKDELKKCFGTEDKNACAMEILKNGEIQVTDKERQQLKEDLLKDIANVVASKCIDPETKRPITVGIVERAMKDIHFSVNEKRSAKQQALEVIRLLKEKIPIERAKMRLKIHMAGKDGSRIKEKLSPLLEVMEKEEHNEEIYEVVCLIDPGNFREIDELVKKTSKNSGTIEVLNLAVTEEGDSKIE